MEILLIILELAIADLILGGDNAIVISMATKNLPDEFKLKASVWGAFFAIILRVVFIAVIIIFGEMHIIFINILAGLLLIKVATDMMSNDEEDHEIDASNSFVHAVKTIVLADAVMSFDNAIVIASIAERAPVGHFMEMLLIIGALLISFPIILFGARLLTSVIEKFSIIVYIFGIMLIHIGVELIVEDHIFSNLHLALIENNEFLSLWIVSLIIFAVTYFVFNRKES